MEVSRCLHAVALYSMKKLEDRMPRSGHVIGSTGIIPGGLVANLLYIFLLFLLPAECTKVIISECAIRYY